MLQCILKLKLYRQPSDIPLAGVDIYAETIVGSDPYYGEEYDPVEVTQERIRIAHAISTVLTHASYFLSAAAPIANVVSATATFYLQITSLSLSTYTILHNVYQPPQDHFKQEAMRDETTAYFIMYYPRAAPIEKSLATYGVLSYMYG